jgi:hypothetical protein
MFIKRRSAKPPDQSKVEFIGETAEFPVLEMREILISN